jgi:hypothetical protein
MGSLVTLVLRTVTSVELAIDLVEAGQTGVAFGSSSVQLHRCLAELVVHVHAQACVPVGTRRMKQHLMDSTTHFKIIVEMSGVD